MKKNAVICTIIVVSIVIVLFFPVSKTHTISGTGHVLNGDIEAVAECCITIEIKELRSLLLRYRMDFSFDIDGTHYYATKDERFPVSASVSEYGDTLITQMYYDAAANHMKLCSLFYSGDLAYAEIFWDDNYYDLSFA